jgi:hypothetical protein
MSAIEIKGSTYQQNYDLSIAGLDKIYVNQESNAPTVYLEFDEEKNLNAANEKIKTACFWTTNSRVHLATNQDNSDQKETLDLLRSLHVPKAAHYVVGYSAKQMGTVGNPVTSVDALIKSIAKYLQSGNDFKQIPVVGIQNNELKCILE